MLLGCLYVLFIDRGTSSINMFTLWQLTKLFVNDLCYISILKNKKKTSIDQLEDNVKEISGGR